MWTELLVLSVFVTLYFCMPIETCSVCGRRYRCRSKYIPIENCCSLDCYLETNRRTAAKPKEKKR